MTILLPSGQKAQLFPAGIIADLATAVVDAAVPGTLHAARQKIVPNCMKIMRALATTGEVALIDEATGYQYHRAPDALQDPDQQTTASIQWLVGAALPCGLLPRHLPVVRLEISGPRPQPTACAWPDHAALGPYGPVLPAELIDEIRNRKGITQKHHQWLSDKGLSRMETQISRGDGDCPQLGRLPRLQPSLAEGRLVAAHCNWRC